MKTKLLLTLSIGFFFLSFGFAQTTSVLEIFSENGEPFFLTVNGVKQNEEAATNVRATDLRGDFHKVTVSFKDQSLGGVSQNFMLDPGMEQRAAIVLRRNGSYAIRPFGEPVPVKAATPSTYEVPQERVQLEAPEKVNPTSKVTTTTTTTTTVGSGRNTETVRMDVGVGDQKFAVNVEINDPLMEGGTTVETTETVITREERLSTPAAAPARSVEPEVKCGPMEAGSFASAKRSIEGKSFADEKKTTARQVLRSSCMSTNQIIEIMGLFSFEDDKLEFAKMAYDRCSDPENYWKVNDAFTYSDSIEQLDEFLESK